MLAATAAGIAASTGNPIATAVVDLRDIAAFQSIVADHAGRIGPLRVLLNTAGDDARVPWDQVTPDDWDDRFAVNVRPAIHESLRMSRFLQCNMASA